MREGHKKPARLRLLLADVDGTLVTKEKHLTDRAIAAVQALKAHGIAFAITSGRPPRGMRMLIAPLALETPIAGFNGGVFTTSALEPIEAHTLPRDVAEAAIASIRKAGMDAWVYSGDRWLVHNDRAPHVDREAWTVQFSPEMVESFGSALESAVKIVGVSDDHDLVRETEASVAGEIGGRASVARSQPYYLDVTHKDANKGGVVAYLSRQLSIAPEEIATIGDQPNDTRMFAPSGLAIAMGQAEEDVRNAADYVTESSEDEGFAFAIERYLLPLAAPAAAGR